jgi:type II secretory pathway pseudopilin PulG
MNTDKTKQHTECRNERGYALVGLMGVMMFALILTTAAAPTLRREAQREREEEMLWRGQQVAWAIAQYRLPPPRGRGTWPTDLNELVEGIDIGAKKIRLLRPSALCDPMTPCTDGTNWRLVHPGDPLPKELLDAIVATQEKKQVPLNPQSLTNLAMFAQLGAVNLPGQAADTKLDGNIGPVNNDQNNDSGSDEKKRPIIGVVSKKSDKMFRSYFGIEEYDHALFFPDVPVMVGGFVNPLAINAVAVNNPTTKDQNCPGGGVFIDTGDGGKCWGGLIPGRIKRDPNAQTPTESPKP